MDINHAIQNGNEHCMTNQWEGIQDRNVKDLETQEKQTDNINESRNS